MAIWHLRNYFFFNLVRIWIGAAAARRSPWQHTQTADESERGNCSLAFFNTQREMEECDAIAGPNFFGLHYISFPSVNFWWILIDKIFSGKLWCKAGVNASQQRPPICTRVTDWVTAANRLNGLSAAYGRQFSKDFWVSRSRTKKTASRTARIGHNKKW